MSTLEAPRTGFQSLLAPPNSYPAFAGYMFDHHSAYQIQLPVRTAESLYQMLLALQLVHMSKAQSPEPREAVSEAKPLSVWQYKSVTP